MTRRRRTLREFYEMQLWLWAGYGRRYELSGLEARAMLRTLPAAPLRWAGGRLEGPLLPEVSGSS